MSITKICLHVFGSLCFILYSYIYRLNTFTKQFILALRVLLNSIEFLAKVFFFGGGGGGGDFSMLTTHTEIG